jgi:error-prone DNA polymerase
MSNIVRLPKNADRGKRGERITAPANGRTSAFAYAELAVTTNFSFLRGASHPEELMLQAIALGVSGIGIADRNSVAGVVRAHYKLEEMKERFPSEHGIELPPFKLVVGARLVFADGTPDILAYPQNRVAWGRLTHLISIGKSRGEKAECILYFEDLVERIAGLNLIVMPPAQIDETALADVINRLRATSLRPPIWLAAAMLYRGDDNRRLARLQAIVERASVPLISMNDVLYHAPERRALQNVMTCIREHVTIDKAGKLLEANAERHLKSPQEMARLFHHAPAAIDQTIRLLDRCRFSLSELENTEYPDETREGYAAPHEALKDLVEKGARQRYPSGVSAKVRYALDRELEFTEDRRYAKYFLTIHEIVAFARSKGILCQGRGSAANSVICYCLGITEVDPEKVNLLFERFLSKERKEPPDIDVDFEHERREEVIQHIYEKYGRHHAAMTATVIRYRGRSAIREVGKAFGLSDDTVGALAGMLWGWSQSGVKEQEARKAGLDPDDPSLNQVMRLAEELIDTPRHLSQHPGGFLITRSRIDEVVPVENAAMDDRTVIEWEKDDLATLRLLKVDVLGLGMLSCLRRGFDLLRIHYRQSETIARLLQQEHDDQKENAQKGEHVPVYKMIQRADTLGTFQIESRAQMSMLPRLRPEKFYDLVIEVAIVRPGPIQGKMVHPYLQRRETYRETKEEPPYPFPTLYPDKKDELRSILHKTLGIPLFQEQAMRIAMDAAEFSDTEANGLRRAMATFRRAGTIQNFEKLFIERMTERGYDPKFTRSCFDQIRGFGEYGFPESHAASFANLVYVSCWMKCYYPDVFAAALLNSQPMGFYAPAQIVRDAREHGVEVRPTDVNLSDWDCTLEALSPSVIPGQPEGLGPESITTNGDYGFRARDVVAPRNDNFGSRVHPRHTSMQPHIRTTHAMRLGFRQISGFSEDHTKIIESTRGRGFDSVRDLWLRTRLPPSALERLANADAFGSLGLTRRDALWAVRALQRAGDKDDLPLFRRVAMPEMEPDVDLPPMPVGEQVVEDYRHLHLSLKAHPLSFLRGDLDARGITPHEQLPSIPNGQRVTVAGLVLVRQRPGTAKGVIFMTLEDETGIANTIVWARAFEQFRPVVIGARLVAVTGPVQSASGVIHVVTEKIEDLTPLLRHLADAHGGVQSLANADEIRRPAVERHRHPRAGDALVLALKETPRFAGDIAVQTARVMPKGRNFH